MTSCAIEQDATLYVTGDLIHTSQCLVAETQCIFLLAAYCKNIELDLVLTSKKECETEEKVNTGVPTDSFKSVSYQCIQDVTECVTNCELPAVCTNDQVNVYSGLCTVLRYLVKRVCHFSSIEEKIEILSLLGHRLYCLKACSEVSPRTKLCEIQMPFLINDSTKWCNNQNTIPEPIFLFETLMQQPVIIHNMDKRQRVLLQRLKKNEDGQSHNDKTEGKKSKEVVWTKDLPALQHVFAEGVDFSLTDICIFPCIHFFLHHTKMPSAELEIKIPKTWEWYGRTQDVERFSMALAKCNMSSHICYNTNNFMKNKGTEVLELAINGNENARKREKQLDLTLRRDLPDLLEKLSSNGLTTSFSKFDSKDIEINWSNLPKELHPTEGELSSLRALRKCHQIENLAYAVKSLAKDGDKIVDFCSGGGHVGIVLARLLPNCKIALVENKEESLDRARSRIYALGLKNVTIFQCNLEYFRSSFDIGVALHACGVATDMVIQSCISKNASFVISPCCYGKVQNSHWITYPQSKLFQDVPISFEESLLLGRAADKTSWNFDNKHAVQGKLCMGIVDLDRSNSAQEHKYDVNLYTMQPHTCSPKNNLLVGKAPSLHQSI